MPNGIRPARYFESESNTSNNQISTTARDNFVTREKMDRKYDLKLISPVNHAPGQQSTPAPGTTNPDPPEITRSSLTAPSPNSKLPKLLPLLAYLANERSFLPPVRPRLLVRLITSRQCGLLL